MFQNARRIIRSALLIASIVSTGLFTSAAQRASLIPIKSEQSGLPESIRRETFATISRARQSVLDRRDANNLWTRKDGAQTAFPVLALCDPFPETFAKEVDLSLQAAKQRLAEKRSQPWTSATASEATVAALASRMNAASQIDAHVLTRLSRIKLSTLPPTEAALVLIALEHNSISVEGGWHAVINTIRRSHNPDTCQVAIAALGRLKSAPSGTGKLGDDVRAHIRWLVNHLSLHGNNTSTAETADALTPEAAFFITLLASRLPRQTLARDSSLFPYNWRNHIANRLIAQQRYDPETGCQYWEASASSESDLQTTTYAIMTLVLLAE